MPDTLTEQDRALVCARLSEAAYGATDNEYRTSASALGFNVETIFHDGQTETRGMLVYNATTKVLALVFRGTVASFLMQNLSTDLWQESEQLALNKDPNVRVIQGFARAWRTIAGAVAAAVNQKLTAIGGPGVLTAFYFTGHSLGGALATYASLEIGTMLERKYNFRNSLVVRVITIAAPPTGTNGFVRYYLARRYLYSTVNYATPNDSVTTGLATVLPGIQLDWGKLSDYSTASETVTLPSTASFPAAHSLSTYIDLLTAAAGSGLRSLEIHVTTGSDAVAPWWVPDSPGTAREVMLTIGGGPGEPQIKQALHPLRGLTAIDIAEFPSTLPDLETTNFEPGVARCRINHPELLTRRQLKRWRMDIDVGGGFWNAVKTTLFDKDNWNFAGLKIVADGQVVYDNQLINVLLGPDYRWSYEGTIP